MKILIVDDDSRIRKLLSKLLKDEFVVDCASNAEEAEMLAYSTPYNVIIVDLILPDMDGEELCSLMKARLPNVPIIAMSEKNSVSDKKKVFDNGVDDYLVKPFSSRELKMRIKAVARRIRDNSYPSILSAGNLKLNLDTKRVSINGKRVLLRRKELQLLEYILLNRGRVVSRGEILESVWDRNINPFTNTVEVHIKRLRDKLRAFEDVDYIETVYGMGYLIE